MPQAISTSNSSTVITSQGVAALPAPAATAVALAGMLGLAQYFLPKVQSRGHVGSPQLRRPKPDAQSHRSMIRHIKAQQSAAALLHAAPATSESDRSAAPCHQANPAPAARHQQAMHAWPALTRAITLVADCYRAVDQRLHQLMVHSMAAAAADANPLPENEIRLTCNAEGFCVPDQAGAQVEKESGQTISAAPAIRQHATPAALKKHLKAAWEIEYSPTLKKHPRRNLEGVLIVIVDLNHYSKPMETRIRTLVQSLLTHNGDLMLAELGREKANTGFCHEKLALDSKVRCIGIDDGEAYEKSYQEFSDARRAAGDLIIFFHKVAGTRSAIRWDQTNTIESMMDYIKPLRVQVETMLKSDPALQKKAQELTQISDSANAIFAANAPVYQARRHHAQARGLMASSSETCMVVSILGRAHAAAIQQAVFAGRDVMYITPKVLPGDEVTWKNL